MQNRKTVQPISLIKIKVYQQTLALALLVIPVVLILSVINHSAAAFDIVVYVFFILFCLVCLILFQRRGIQFIKPFEHAGYIAVFIYYVLQFIQEATKGTRGTGLEFKKFLLWLAVIYAFSFLVFPARRAVRMSLAFIACIFAIGLVYSVTNRAKPWIADDLITLWQIYSSGLIYISLFYVISILKDQYTESENRSKVLTSLANTDALTGAYSRSKTSELLQTCLVDAAQGRHPFSVIMLDVDKLKHVNDTYGHNAGDYVLRHMVELLRSSLREKDYLGRWGGDEFLVICPDTNEKQAHALAVRLEATTSGEKFAQVGSPSISAGMATCQPGDTPESLLERADQEMYRQKQEKRKAACKLIQ